MAQALILDSEAVNALARPNARGTTFNRARAVLALALDRRALVRRACASPGRTLPRAEARPSNRPDPEWTRDRRDRPDSKHRPSGRSPPGSGRVFLVACSRCLRRRLPHLRSRRRSSRRRIPTISVALLHPIRSSKSSHCEATARTGVRRQHVNFCLTSAHTVLDRLQADGIEL